MILLFDCYLVWLVVCLLLCVCLWFVVCVCLLVMCTAGFDLWVLCVCGLLMRFVGVVGLQVSVDLVVLVDAGGLFTLFGVLVCGYFRLRLAGGFLRFGVEIWWLFAL